jgi:hypothetical protein
MAWAIHPLCAPYLLLSPAPDVYFQDTALSNEQRQKT